MIYSFKSCHYHGYDALIEDVFLQLVEAVDYHGLRIVITDFGFATTDT